MEKSIKITNLSFLHFVISLNPLSFHNKVCVLFVFQQKLVYILAPPLPLSNNSSELSRNFLRIQSSINASEKKYFSTFRLCFGVVCVCWQHVFWLCLCVCVCWQHNNTSGPQTPFPGTFPEVACAAPGAGPGALPMLRESTAAKTGSWVALTLRWSRLSLTPQPETPFPHMKQRVLGSLVRRRRSTARPLHRCGAAATAHPVPGRGGQKGTEGDQRLLEAPTKGSAHLGPGRQERGPERQVSQKFPGLRSHGGRHLIQEASEGTLTGCRRGGRGLEEEGRGKGRGRPPPTARPAPSARPRLVTLGRGRTPEGAPVEALRPPRRPPPRPQIHFQHLEPPLRATAGHSVSENPPRAQRLWT